MVKIVPQACEMKTESREWVFCVLVIGAVLLNELAGEFGVQIITFVSLLLIVLWAGYKFIAKDGSGD